MKLNKLFLAVIIATGICSAQAADRPSLAKHEKRIGDLEIKTIEIEEELTATKELVRDNKILIDENKEALENIAVIEGPPGPAGPRGPKGKDGAFAGLSCQAGQFAQFDGLAWQCTQGTDIAPDIRHQECIQGYDFNISTSGNQIAQSSVNGTWREACGLMTSIVELRGPIVAGPPGRNLGIATPMITQEISAPEIQLEGDSYSDSLLGIYPHSVNASGPVFLFTLVFINEEIYEDFVNWNLSGQLAELEFVLRQDDMGLELIFDRCHVDNFSAVPEFSRDQRGEQVLMAKQTLTLDCGSMPSIEHADPLWREVLETFTAASEMGFSVADATDVTFDSTVDPNMSAFDRSYGFTRFTEIELPAFYQDPNNRFGREISPWIAGPHRMQLEVAPPIADLPL